MFRAALQQIKKIGLCALIFLIKIYQTIISPFFGPCCRFFPSCSDYAKESLKEHGILRGVYFTLCRLIRCHPFHSGGYDPPHKPEQRIKKNGH